MTRCSTSCARSSATIPSWSRPTRRPSGWAPSRSRSSRRSRTCSRCTRSRTRARRRSCGRGSRACARTSRARGSRIRRFEFVAEPKIDGLAISLVYRDGVLERGATRGNGEVGEDVTHNLRTIPSIPLSFEDAPPLIEVRGEIYMSLSDFAALNERRAQAGLADVHEPTQLGGGDDPPARPAARRRAAAVDVVLRDRRDRGDLVLEPLGGARVAARARLPRQRRRQEARLRGRRRRAVPGLAGAPRRARLRDRRRRGQGRRRRAAAAPRRRRARPALGDRVEVPAHHRGHEAQRRSSGTSASSATCTPSPRSSPSTSAASRSSWRRCTTRRTSRARTSASATR